MHDSKHSQQLSLIVTIFFFLVAVSLTFFASYANLTPFEIVGLFTFCVVACVIILRPRWGFYILLVSRPLVDIVGQRVSISYENIGTLNLNAIFGIFVFVWGSLFLLYKRVQVSKIPATYPLLLLSIITGISIFTTEYAVDAFGEWIRVTNYLIIFLLGYHFTSNWYELRKTTVAILLSSIAPLFLGLYQLFTGSGLADEASSNRILGTFAHPSLFGQYLAAFCLITFAFALISKESKHTYQSLFVIYLAALLATFARGPWIYALLGIALLVFLFYRKQFWSIAGYALATFLVVGFVVFYLQAFTDFKPSETALAQRFVPDIEQDGSVAWRFRFWGDSLGPASDHAFIGYGAGTFIEFAENELNTSFDAHNDYLKLLVELGLPGLITLVMFFGLLFFTSFSLYQKAQNKNERILAALLLAETIGLIFVSFFDNVYQNTTLYWLLLVFFGGSFRILTKSKNERLSSSSSFGSGRPHQHQD